MIQGLHAATINEADMFVYAVGRIRVQEASLLARLPLERAVEAGSAERAWEVIRDASGWWSGRGGAGPQGWEPHLEARLAESLKEVAFIGAGSPIASLFAIRWDFLRLKEKVREAVFGDAVEGGWPERIAEEGGFLLSAETPLAYREVLARLSERVSRETLPQTVDRVLDAEMFRIVFRRLCENPVPFARQYFVRRVDLLNLSVTLRGKLRAAERQEVQGWLMPGGSLPASLFLEAWGGALASFAGPFERTVLETLVDDLVRQGDEGDVGRRLERRADDHLTEFLHAGKYVTFGPEPLVGYLHAIEMEVKNVRRIFTGLERGEAPDSILVDLRHPYV